MQNPQEVQLAVEALRAALPDSAFGAEAPLGLILGTGLSGLAAALAGDAGGAGPCVAPFAQLPGFPLPGVDSHHGAFVLRAAGTGPAGPLPSV